MNTAALVRCASDRRRFNRFDGFRSGFTLIEMIGVLAVIAILAGLTAPVVIRQIDQATNAREETDLKAISDAVVYHILTNKTIPRAADLPATAAAWMNQPVSRVTTTRRGHTRAFVIDGGGWLATVTNTWVQSTTGLVNTPTQARLMIVSCTSGPVPDIAGVINATSFQEIWSTPKDAKPASWTAWSGKPEDLHIQRLNIEPLFHHLALVNRDPPGTARYAINSTNSIGLTNVHRGFYLNGTDLGLFGATGPAQLRTMVVEDKSFVFQAGRWAGDLDPGESYNEVIGNRFAALAGEFLETERFNGAHNKGGNQQGALVSMFNFMLTYQMWADQCPHFPNYGQNPQNVPEYLLLLDVSKPDQNGYIFSFTESLLGPN